LGAAAQALLQLTGALFRFHLMQTAEQRMKIAASQLAIGLPLHGTGFGMATQGGHVGGMKGHQPKHRKRPHPALQHQSSGRVSVIRQIFRKSEDQRLKDASDLDRP
jgi:hypothetical protein